MTSTRFLTLFVLLLSANFAFGQKLKVGVVGLTHDHAYEILNRYKNNEVIILGIAEDNQQAIARYRKIFTIPDSILFKNMNEMLDHIKPDAVLAYNPISEHLSVVEACAPKGISVMVEKPLAVSVEQAEKIKSLATRYHIKVLTNYETTWYYSNQQINVMVNEQHAIGDIRKMVVHDGHQGPKEIGCSKEFLAWLTDPVKNGGGAINDFGCYGANLMTWLMNGKAPMAVTATVKHIKPDVYPNVDDDATIVLEYPDATGIIEASWNWPFSIKDLEVFGKTGYLHALNGNTLQQRMKSDYVTVPLAEPTFKDNLTYLASALQGAVPKNDLSSLENNMIVVKILEAAKISARDGKRVVLK